MSWNIDEDWLRREFEGFGEIIGCRIITDRESGRSKGYVIIFFPILASLLIGLVLVTSSSPTMPMPPRLRRRCTSTNSMVAT
jgi:hypothetical protein